jgi:hypothetical protein
MSRSSDPDDFFTLAAVQIASQTADCKPQHIAVVQLGSEVCLLA